MGRDRVVGAIARISVLAVALALLFPLSCGRRPTAERVSLAGTRSPHGAIAVSCEVCHESSAWKPVRADVLFDHARQTTFVLTGAHTRVECGSCHMSLRFAEPRVAAGDCAACHVDVHAGNLGIQCAGCHETGAFAASARRDVHAGTTFPLTGRHRQIGCESCHGSLADTRAAVPSTQCVSCHAAAYSAATPSHASAGFTTECATCHSSLRWTGARFDHVRATGYPLEGAHGRIECSTCHAPPNFALRFAATGPRDCIGCHRTAYDLAHPGLGNEQACLTCHTQDTFRGARWAEHDARFPIYSGSHARRWTTCAECHQPPGYAAVSCLGCHQHSRTRMDDKHKEQQGYSYTTVACLQCHPRGRKE